MTTFNTQNMFKDVYFMFNCIKGIMLASKRDNTSITIMNIGDSNKFFDYTNNMSSFSHDQITTIAWEFAKSTSRVYANI